MADAQGGSGAEEIPLQTIEGNSTAPNQPSEQRTSSPQVLPVQSSTQGTPDPDALHTTPTESSLQSIHSAPHSQQTPLAENETTTPEAGLSTSSTTTTEPRSRPNSIVIESPVAVAPLPATQNSPGQGIGHGVAHQHTRTKSAGSRLLDLKYPITAIFVVGLTSSLMFTTDYQFAPLGDLGVSGGILILNLLGKATDYSLAASAELMWATLQLGPLLRRREQLLTYLALAPGTSFTHWLKILLLRRSSAGGGGTKRDSWWEKPKFWSLIRLLSWAALQFPGLIVLAVANPETKYYPTSWTQVSGGIGVYDSSIAATGSYLPNLLAGFITTILRDNRRAFQVDPINEACLAAGDTCGSYLILGGLDAISPWPFDQSDSREIYYMTSGEPIYQIDFWTPKEPVIWSASACKLYGFVHLGLKFCIDSPENAEGQIIAGWRDCVGDLTPDGSCGYRDGAPEASQIQSTAMAIYRRTSSITASRNTAAILEVTDLSNPIVQKISPSNFTTAFDAFLLPWPNDFYSDICFTQSHQYQITSYLASSLSYTVLAPVVPIASDLLRNFFATTIFLSNPMTSSVGIRTDPLAVLPGLPTANYFQASRAVGVERVVPARWTALAYVGVASALLGLVLLSQVLTASEDVLVTSGFSLLDGLRLRWMWRDAQGDEAEVECLANTFEGVQAGDDGGIIRRAGDVRALGPEERGTGSRTA